MSPKPIPTPADSSKMLYIWLSDYTANTMTYAAHVNNYLARTFTPRDMPDKYRDLLKTSCSSGLCVGTILPALGSACADCEINVDISSMQAPEFTVSPSQASVSLPGQLEMLQQLK